MSLLRWGICGTGNICHDFTCAISVLPKENHRVSAVFGRDQGKTDKFAETHEVPLRFNSYAEFLASSEIDVVYIGVLNSLHKQMAIEALKAGKHVLCEKPLGINANEVKQMVDTARKSGKFLMEGFWSRFFPVYQTLKSALDNGDIGEPKMLLAKFGIKIIEDAGLLDLSKGGGYLLSTGCYLTMLASFLFGPAKPESILSNGILADNGADTSAQISMKYANGKSAQLLYTNSTLINEAIIIGTKGKLRIPELFWCPTKLELADGTVREFEIPTDPQLKVNFNNSFGLQYEAECVRKCILSGKTECPQMTLSESIALSEINDEIRKQIGVKFTQDQ